MLKKWKVFEGFLLNVSKIILTDFCQTCHFKQLSIVSFEIKMLETGNSFCGQSYQFMRECWAKHHDQREEKWRFS